MMRFTGDGFEDIDIEDDSIFVEDEYDGDDDDTCRCPSCRPDLHEDDIFDNDDDDDNTSW
jgi:hypothetical protein